MYVQQSAASHIDAPLQSALDVFKIVQSAGTEQIDDQMLPCKPDAVTLYEKIFPVLAMTWRRSGTVREARVTEIFLLGGA